MKFQSIFQECSVLNRGIFIKLFRVSLSIIICVHFHKYNSISRIDQNAKSDYFRLGIELDQGPSC